MLFGLKNAGMTFERLMDKMDNGYFDLPFAFIYLYYLQVATCSTEEHRCHLCKVLSWLSANRLVFNRYKCVLG
jgi:hypothetical protein